MASRNGCSTRTSIDAMNPASSKCRDERRDHKLMLARAANDLAPDRRLSRDEGFALTNHADVQALMRTAVARRDSAHGAVVTYSRKVFIPLTQLCRDVCHYCTFAHPPRKGEAAYLTLDQLL